MIIPFLFAFIAFLVSYFSIPKIIKIAINRNLVDMPDARKLHNSPIPALGGIAISLAIWVNCLGQYDHLLNLKFSLILLSSSILLLLGIIDDINPIKARTKLGGQILVAFITVYFADIRITNLYGILDIYTLPIGLSYLLSIFLILTFINSLNLIDGINGLAASLSIIFFTLFAVYFYQISQPFYVLICASIIGALIAFLRYNLFNPSIFLGDSGSMNLGYFASLFCLIFLNTKDNNIDQVHIYAPYGLMFCVFIIPLFDTMRVSFIRIINLRSPFSPDKKHIHHLFLRLGLKHYHISFLLVGVNLIYIATGLFFQEVGDVIIIIAVLSSCILGILIVEFLIKKRIKEGAFNMPFFQTTYQIIHQNWFWFISIIAFTIPFLRWSSSIPMLICAIFWLITLQKNNLVSLKAQWVKIVSFGGLFYLAVFHLLVVDRIVQADAAQAQLLKLALFIAIPILVQAKGHKFLIKYFYIYAAFFIAGILTFCSLSTLFSIFKTLIFNYSFQTFSLVLFSFTDLPTYTISLFLLIAALLVMQLQYSNIYIFRNKWVNAGLVLIFLWFQFLNQSFYGILFSIILFLIYGLMAFIRHHTKRFILIFAIYFAGILAMDATFYKFQFVHKVIEFEYFQIDTSREVCWNASINLIQKSPLWGYGTGYKSFLHKETSYLFYDAPAQIEHFNSYNQFFEYWLRYGILGPIMLFLTFGFFFYIAIIKRDRFLYLFNLAFLVFCLFESLFESQSSIVFFVLTNCMFLLKINKLKVKLKKGTELKNFRRFVHFNYFFFDIIAAILSWTIFFVIRKTNEVIAIDLYHDVFRDIQFFIGCFSIAGFWIILYFYFGFYSDIQKKSRLTELINTFVAVFIGSIVLFFVVILDDKVPNFTFYYKYIVEYIFIHYALTVLFRLFNIFSYKYFLKAKRIVYNTVIIGHQTQIEKVFKEIEGSYLQGGKNIIGSISDEKPNKLGLPHLGHINRLSELFDSHQINEVIIAAESSQHAYIFKLFSDLSLYNIDIKIIPDLYDIISNSLKTNHVMGPLLIEVSNDVMPLWQKNLKSTLDYVISILALIITAPIIALIAILIKLDSKGAVFYKQERIGYRGRKFQIIKFRSMKTNAENERPLLSSDNDTRVTKVGKVLRKWRLDEIPQFVNILKGEMSLIGYRAERAFFIQQITEKNPHYQFLFKIKPGITSMGMINYGYAENVDEMLDRLKYDLVYLKNMSLSLDFKIFLYTIKILIEGRGK